MHVQSVERGLGTDVICAVEERGGTAILSVVGTTLYTLIIIIIMIIIIIITLIIIIIKNY